MIDLKLTLAARKRLQREDVLIVRRELVESNCTDFTLENAEYEVTIRFRNEEMRFPDWMCDAVLERLCSDFENGTEQADNCAQILDGRKNMSRCLMVLTMKRPLNGQQWKELDDMTKNIKINCPEIAHIIIAADGFDVQLLPLDGTKLEPNTESQRDLLDKTVRLIDLQ